jgi:Abnormal spindle-like microcephaly-assoc'd, ASPM-SPD-2-Hydin/Transmembrane protein 131-like N-terminal
MKAGIKRSSLWACTVTMMILGALSGTRAGATTGVTLSPSALSFGSVSIGTLSSPQGFTVMNIGGQDVTLQGLTSSSSQFIVTGPSLPITLAPGQDASFQIVFAPTSAGTFSGSISVSLNRWSQKAGSIAVSGTGLAIDQVQPPQASTYLLSTSATSLNLGTVLVGASGSQSVALTNTGNSSVNISQVDVTGAGFTATGIALPLTLGAGQSTSITIGFSPAAAGTVTGGVSVVSTATNSPATMLPTGTGVQPQISVVPSPVAFGNATVGVSNTQTMTIQNTGTANLSVTQATVSGQGFALSGLAVPLSVAPGGSASLTISFTPTSATNFSGTLSLSSNAPVSPSTVALTGSGLAQTLQLSVNPTSLSFGSATVGTSTSSQSVTISNTGNSDVSVTQIVVSGTAYSVTGAMLPITLSTGHNTSFTAVFAPLTAGNLAGSISVVSTATNSPAMVTLSGSGVQSTSHSANLAWSDSSTALAGFNIYRGTTTGGPYTKVNSALIPTSTYTDTSVQSGTTYYYVTTAVDSTGLESTYSNEGVALIP